MVGVFRKRARFFARVFVALVVGGAVLCTIGYALGGEHPLFLEGAQYIPYPVFLVPALVAVALSFWLGRVWRVTSFLGLVLVATAVMGFEFRTGEAGVDRVRVMTYNIKWYLAMNRPEGLMLIAREIALHDPDILVLQDASALDRIEEGSPGAFRAMFGVQNIHFDGEYIVASRYPLRDCKPRPMSFRDREHSYVQCTIEARGIEVDVVTAHFLTPRRALNAVRAGSMQAIEEWQQNLSDRTSQAAILAGDLGVRRRPTILAGDFNATEASSVVRMLLATGLRDAFSTAGKGYGYTWGHSLRPGISFLRIDHIFVSPEIGVGKCFVGGWQASPHRPVIADLYLTRRP
jgi:vancomycin resistance protein VanJ